MIGFNLLGVFGTAFFGAIVLDMIHRGTFGQTSGLGYALAFSLSAVLVFV